MSVTDRAPPACRPGRVALCLRPKRGWEHGAVKYLPFDQGYPEHTELLLRAREKYVAVWDETKKRYRTPEREWGDRVGFGAVYAAGRLSGQGFTLSSWNWRRVWDEAFPSWLEASYFDDDPAHLNPAASLASRYAVAVAFAEAANFVLNPVDGEFGAVALELVEASPERPAGIYPGEEADVLAVDLMIGRSNHAVIDTLVRGIWEKDPHSGSTSWVAPEHIELWHRTERLNAARAMLVPDAPLVKLPAMTVTRRRLKTMHDACTRNTREAWRRDPTKRPLVRCGAKPSRAIGLPCWRRPAWRYASGGGRLAG